jgi:prephenate dehydratase
MRIAFQGEQGAYSELAAKEFFGVSKKYFPVPEFTDVYNAVSKGKAEHGILPIENSLAGSIHQNYDILLKGDLFIIGEIFLKVSHYLIANEGVSRKKIRNVYSHPQALAQCKNYLKKYKNITLIPVSNTASAVRMIKKEKLNDSAAIASMQAAIDYNMAVFGKRIEDVKNNQTRFIMLGKKPLQIKSKRKKAKTSIVFTLKNLPGALFRALSVFALRDIDLHKIESRPVYGRNFEYMFYLDFEGHIEEEAQKNAVNHLREITSFERVLGSYYAGNIVHPVYQKR